MQALLSGQVDAIGCSTTVAAQIAKRSPDRFENKFVLLQQEMAVAMRPGEPDTLKAINELVDKNIQNGEFSKLFQRSEEHTSELQSLMRISYAVFCLKKKKK